MVQVFGGFIWARSDFWDAAVISEFKFSPFLCGWHQDPNAKVIICSVGSCLVKHCGNRHVVAVVRCQHNRGVFGDVARLNFGLGWGFDVDRNGATVVGVGGFAFGGQGVFLAALGRFQQDLTAPFLIVFGADGDQFSFGASGQEYPSIGFAVFNRNVVPFFAAIVLSAALWAAGGVFECLHDDRDYPEWDRDDHNKNDRADGKIHENRPFNNGLREYPARPVVNIGLGALR